MVGDQKEADLGSKFASLKLKGLISRVRQTVKILAFTLVGFLAKLLNFAARVRDSFLFGFLSVCKNKFIAEVSGRPVLLGAVLLLFLSVFGARYDWSPGQVMGGVSVEKINVGQPAGVLVSSDSLLVKKVFAESYSQPVSATASSLSGSLLVEPWASITPAKGLAALGAGSYTVQSGDTLSAIAEQFNVSTNSIAWSNNIFDPDSIRDGDVLRIPPSDGVLHIVKNGETLAGIVNHYSANLDETAKTNGFPASGKIDLAVGRELFIPNGHPPVPPPPPPAKSGSPSNYQRGGPPRFASSTVGLGYFIAPTAGIDLGRLHPHNAVDIDNSCGAPVYAAADGVVAEASLNLPRAVWNGGYGNYIFINHPNGTGTRYAHLSGVLVSAGQNVRQGQQIGAVGSTGRSTGCHLHWEVWGSKNPLARY